MQQQPINMQQPHPCSLKCPCLLSGWLNPDPGPSRLIQVLLSRLLNPGELEWLQLLNRREELEQQHTALQVSWLKVHADKPSQIDLLGG
jgi:hypothetical protein